MAREKRLPQNQPVRVSIVVACRNEMADIRAFVDSLLAQDADGLQWEAILADGMSDDGTRQFLEDLPAAFATFHVSYGLGFAAGLLRLGSRPAELPVSGSAFTRLTR